MWGSLIIVVLLFAWTERINAVVCPDEDPVLTLWSDASTWTSNGLPVPGTNSTVAIKSSMNVKLDVDLDVHSITIEPNGRLVWGSGRDSTVRTYFIYIQGTMEIGSENCQFSRKTEIILKGTRGEITPNVPGCGEKFLCVAAGGTLELHGKDKRSWTKLSQTLPKVTLGDGILFQHRKSSAVGNDWMQGLRVYEFDGNAQTPIKSEVFYLSGNDAYWTGRGLSEIGPFINGIPNGHVVAIALLRKLVGSSDLSTIYTLLESLGAQQIRDVDGDDAYVFIAIKGDVSTAVEDIDRSSTDIRMASVSLDFTNQQIVAISQVKTNSWGSTFADFLIFDINRVYPTIDTVENVQDWEEGDKILFTSTDFDMEQAEVGMVKACPTCGQKQFRVYLPAQYTHYAKLKNNIDMRGEVALLTRNIKIRGKTQPSCPASNGNCGTYSYDTFGGHVKFLKDFANVHVEGVELVNMGQQTSVGNYPLHFHMCLNTANYSNSPYLRRNSIVNSFARCITIHGTHGVLVQDNVCYDTLGHSIFLEDGGEKNTVIDGNLVAITRKGGLIPSDSRPASYWITNPLTTIRNNVAAGSVEMGYWIIYPDEPTGPSRSLGFMAKYEAKYTKLTEMDNNAGHSNNAACLFIDNRINDNLQITGTNEIYPRTTPLDPKGANAQDDPYYITKQTCWKNRGQSSWVRGGAIIMQQYSSADTAKGLTFARSSSQEQFIERSVFAGETENIGEPTEVWNSSLNRMLGYPRSLIFPWDDKNPVQGFIYYDGPVYVDQVWFTDFKSTDNYTSAAIGFLRNNRFSSSPVSGMTNIKFGFSDPTGGNRVYDGNETVHGFGSLDGDKGATFRDEDGSVTGYTPIQQIVKPGRFYTTSSCKFRANWNMAICPYKYGKMDVNIDNGSPDRGQTDAIMVRDDDPDYFETLKDDQTAQFMAILGGSHSYTLHWSNKIPSKFEIRTLGVESGLHVRLGICLPIGATFDLWTYSPLWRPSTSTWTSVSSIQDLDTDTEGDRYFWDSSIGMLFLKFINYNDRSQTTSDCQGNCPMVRITVTSGDRTNGDCRQKAYVNPGNYRKPSTGPMSQVDSRNLPVTAASPPVGWGAGSQIPFSSRTPIDGGFSAWGPYSDCSVTCGGGTKSRYRQCNNPAPANGGADCVGEVSEDMSCNEQECAVNGGFADWGPWGSCIVESGCQGYRERTRTCTSPLPVFGGLHCSGFNREQQACNTCAKRR